MSYQDVSDPHQTTNKPDYLEYFIRFPSSHSNKYGGLEDTNIDDTDYVLVYDETNIPIVILLGWAGCQDKYLMKYSKIYEDRGLITIRYTAPVENLFWKRQGMKSIGEKIVKLIYDMSLDSHPIIFHVFSNGGAFLYQHIALGMKRTGKTLQVKGMIFDSAPGERRYLGLYRAISAIYGKGYRLNSLLSFCISIVLIVIWWIDDGWCLLKNLFFDGDPIQSNPVVALRDESSDSPQMFLYSKEDLLIPYYDVERFADHRRKRGVKVTSVCFEGSLHVKHYIKHPRLYIYWICKFIRECLSFDSTSSTRINSQYPQCN